MVCHYPEKSSRSHDPIDPGRPLSIAPICHCPGDMLSVSNVRALGEEHLCYHGESALVVHVVRGLEGRKERRKIESPGICSLGVDYPTEHERTNLATAENRARCKVSITADEVGAFLE